ncbi:MAG: YqaJ viral recombinase family protein [Burkholderiaceae bacterium]
MVAAYANTVPRARPARRPRHDRRRALGGSEIAAVMGISPWQTPVDLWREKTGRAGPPKVDPIGDAIKRRGQKLEPYVRAMAIDKVQQLGLDVELVAKNARYFDPELPWLTSEIDFELRVSGVAEISGMDVRFEDELITADCKTATGFARRAWGDEGTDAVPIYYAAQFMQGLGITGRRWCLCAALIGLDDVALYWIPRDEVTIPAMRERAVDFWENHVLADVPPDPIKYADIRELYPQDNGRTVEATSEVAEAARELRRLGLEMDRLDARREQLKLQVAEYLGDYRTLAIEGRPAYTMASFETSKVNVAAMRRQHPGLVELFTERGTARALQPNRGFRG